MPARTNKKSGLYLLYRMDKKARMEFYLLKTDYKVIRAKMFESLQDC